MKLTAPAIAHFERCHGIASISQLIAAGVGRHAIKTLRRDGSLEPVLQGAYRLAGVPLTELGRCAAVCAAHPGQVIAGPTAGRLWGLRRLPRDRRVHTLSPPHSQPTRTEWVVPYRTAAFHQHDVVERTDGITVTSRPRTALDLARFVNPADLLSVIEQVMHDGGHSTAEIREVAVDWLSPRRRWVRTFLEIVERRVRGGPAESHLEVVLGDELRRAGVQGMVRQFDIELPGYGPARFDLAVPVLRWAIEVDGFPTHSETAGRRADRRRDEGARRIGWHVSRVPGPGIETRLAATVDDLLSTYHTLATASGEM